MKQNETHSREAEKVRAARVLAHPAFRSMARQKAWLGRRCSAIVFAMYVAYSWVIGKSPQTLPA